MKTVTQLFLLACLMHFLLSCGFTEPQEVVVNEKYKMTIPGHMYSTKTLNDDASLQYQNPRREIYIMVIEDNPDEINNAIINRSWEERCSPGFDGFCTLATAAEEDNFLIADDSDKLQDDTINGHRARTFENIRQLNGVEVFYKIALIEGESTFYQIIAWTLPDKEKDHGEIMQEMINSFAEL